MIVMLIFMVLPILCIPVFWFLPPGPAIIVYLLSLALSGWMFWLMRRNKRYRVVTGKEGLIGSKAEVISISTSEKENVYTVRTEGELWTGRSNDSLKRGETIEIVAVEGSVLKLRRTNHDS